MMQGQAAALLPMIAEVLAAAGETVQSIDLIGVTVGPGRFTGLRIALAAAHGLALASGKPAVGVSCFAAIAAAVPDSACLGRTLVVAIDSKREELFLQAGGASAMLAPAAWEAWVPPGDLLLAGDGAARLAARLGPRAALAPAPGAPDAATVARLASAGWRPGQPAPPPRPLYLRAPDTTQPKAVR
jgi:tRNA threonylcarbamoyladenosine biosynthesis protein TsaB